MLGPARPGRPLCTALACAMLLLAATRASALDSERPVVILLSWDGVRYDYPSRVSLPGLSRMQREGARADRLTPVYPSDTFPNHVSLATGTHPDTHGILGNKFRDRTRDPELFSYENDASWLEAEPLWVAAERQGVRAASFFWVGSETDWRGVGASYRKTPFDSSIGEREKVDQILAWLDLPAAEQPRLIMSWWHGADHTGHRKGPDHPGVLRDLEGQDRELARLLAGLDAREAWGHTTLLVVSDHGMTTVTEPVPFGERLADAGIRSHITRSSSTAQIYLKDLGQLAAAEAALGGLAGIRVYRRDALPEKLRLRHPTRCGDLIVTTDPPRTLIETSAARKLMATVGSLAGWSSGMHGYDPELPEMGAILYALGRGVAAGATLRGARTIDVAATVAGLLGIDPPHSSEGRRISGIGQAATD
jgi:predicted AlkP superfamily pyrophosphatase or phosphodiesterase